MLRLDTGTLGSNLGSAILSHVSGSGRGDAVWQSKDLLLFDRLLPPGRDPGALAARLPGPAAWPSALGHYGSESRPPVAPRIATVCEFGEMPSGGRVAAVPANAVIAAFEPPEGSIVPAGHGGRGRSRPVTAGHGRSRRSRPARPVTACTAVVAVAPLARRTGYARARCACGWTAMMSERKGTSEENVSRDECEYSTVRGKLGVGTGRPIRISSRRPGRRPPPYPIPYQGLEVEVVPARTRASG